MSRELEPIHNQILFKFLDDTAQGHFNAKSAGGVLLVEHSHNQVEFSRWGTAVAVGPNVADVDAGDVILIDNLRWTSGFQLNDEMHWITTETEVLCLWDDPKNLPYEVAQ
jgi:hypothetical protein